MSHAADQFEIAIKPHALRAEVVTGVVDVGCSLAELGAGNSVLAFIDGVPVTDLLVQPQAGQAVVLIRVPQGSDNGKAALRIVAAIAITWFSYGTAGPWAAGAGASAGVVNAWGAAFSLVGNLALNALIPPPSPQLDAPEDFKPFNRLTNTANQVLPFGAIPRLYGHHRIFPPLGSLPYTEQVGSDQYLRMLFCLGYGPLTIDAASAKIGDTTLSEYEHEIEIREGTLTDAPLTLFTRNVAEVALADALNEDGVSVTRTSGAGGREVSLDFVAGGLRYYRRDKQSPRAVAVGFRLEYRPVGGGAWTTVTPAIAEVTGDGGYSPNFPALSESYTPGAGTIFPGYPFVALPGPTGEKCFYLRGSDLKPYALSVRVTLPAEGAYDFRVTRIAAYCSQDAPIAVPPDPPPFIKPAADRVTEPNQELFSEFTWSAIRTIGADVSQTVPAGLAFIAMRIKATDQLNGTLSNFSIEAHSRLPVWNGSAWVEEETSNPAFIYRDIFVGAANAAALPAGRLDHDTITAWAAECDSNNREFNGIFSSETTVFEAAKSVASAGRGSFQIRDSLYSVVRDRAGQLPVQVFTPRNSWDFSFTKTFVRPVHGLRIKFKNRETDWLDDERIVYADGYNADGSGGLEVATVFESLSLFGVTDPAQVWRDGRYHQAVAKLRPETYLINAQIEHLVCQRGDVVRLQHDAMLVGLGAGRIKTIAGATITLDESLAIESGKTYQVIIRRDTGEEATATITNAPGVTSALTLSGGVPAGVKIGDLVAFGESGLVTTVVLITGVEPGDDLSARITSVPYAQPAVDEAETGPIPDFDPLITRAAETPPAPRIISVATGPEAAARGPNGALLPRILVGYSFPSSGVNVTHVEAALRREQEQAFATQAPQVNNGQYTFAITSPDDTYFIRLRGISDRGIPGGWTEVEVDADARVDVELLDDALTLLEQRNNPESPNGDLSTVIATVAPPEEATNYSYAFIDARRVGAQDWQLVGPTDENHQARLVLTANGAEYEFRARPVSTRGYTSADGPRALITLSVADGTVAGGDPDAAATPDAELDVVEIRVQGEVVGVMTFTGRDAAIEWDAVTPPTGQILRDYRVRVIDTDSATVLRVAYVVGTGYRYGFDANVADSALLGASPRRALTFEVIARSEQGAVSETPATKAITNPAPSLPGDFAVYAYFNGVEINFSRPNDGDYARARVYLSTVDGFTPGPSNLVYEGAETWPIFIPGLDPATTYYFRIQLSDVFGDAAMGAQMSATTTATPGADTTPPSAPTGLTLSQAVVSAGQTTLCRLTADWSAGSDDSGKLFYQVEYWVGSSQKITMNTTLLTFTVQPAQVGATYSVRLRAVDYSGNTSDWTATQTLAITGDVTPPANVTSLAVTAGLNRNVLTWTNPADADLAKVRVYRGTSSGFTANSGSLIGTTDATTWVDTTVVTGTDYYYKTDTVDVSGNASTSSSAVGPAAPYQITGANVDQFLAPSIWGAATLRRKPRIIVARKRAAQVGNPPAVATLTALADLDVFTGLSATVADCRAFDVVVVDSDTGDAAEHNDFIRQLWEDGQRVWVTGSNSGTGVFYIAETQSAGAGGTVTPTAPSHPINAGIVSIVETSAGLHIKTLGATAERIASPGIGYENDTAIALVPHPNGGLIVHTQWPMMTKANAQATRLRQNIIAHLVGPSISVNHLKARTIQTSMLAVGDLNNLVENAEFEAGDIGWVRGTGWTIVRDPANAQAGDFCARRAAGSASTLRNGYLVSAAPGDGYYARASIKNSVASHGGFIRIEWLDVTGAVLSTSDGNATTATSYTLSEVNGIAPASTFFARLCVHGTNSSGTLTADRGGLFRTASAVLIQDGAIIANKIAANAITADKITANAITTDKVASGAITAAKISVTSLSAISADIGAVTAGTITGVTIQTSGSGQRVVLNTDDEAEFYDDFGSKAVTIGISDTPDLTREAYGLFGILFNATTGVSAGVDAEQSDRYGVVGVSRNQVAVGGSTWSGVGVYGEAYNTGVGMLGRGNTGVEAMQRSATVGAALTLLPGRVSEADASWNSAPTHNAFPGSLLVRRTGGGSTWQLWFQRGGDPGVATNNWVVIS